MYSEARTRVSKLVYPFDKKFVDRLSTKWYSSDNEVPCAHNGCPECGGSGVKHNGVSCVHMLSCRCKVCSPHTM